MGKDKSKRKERDEDPEERERRRSRKKSEKVNGCIDIYPLIISYQSYPAS